MLEILVFMVLPLLILVKIIKYLILMENKKSLSILLAFLRMKLELFTCMMKKGMGLMMGILLFLDKSKECKSSTEKSIKLLLSHLIALQ